MLSIKQMARIVGKVTKDNSPLILTTIGVTGTLSTAFFAARATYRAAEIIIAAEAPTYERNADGTLNVFDTDPFTTKEKVGMVWHLYVPPLSVAAVTVTCIILANRIGTRRAAALATAYTVLDQGFTEYRDKIVEKIGESKERTARDEIAQQKTTANPPGSSGIYVTNKGAHKAYDNFSGRWFETSMQQLLSAQNKINYILVSGDGYASVNQFYDRLGLPTVEVGEQFGWTSDNQLELMITTTVTDEDEPAFHIEFRSKPIGGYYRARH